MNEMKCHELAAADALKVDSSDTLSDRIIYQSITR